MGEWKPIGKVNDIQKEYYEKRKDGFQKQLDEINSQPQYIRLKNKSKKMFLTGEIMKAERELQKYD